MRILVALLLTILAAASLAVAVVVVQRTVSGSDGTTSDQLDKLDQIETLLGIAQSNLNTVRDKLQAPGSTPAPAPSPAPVLTTPLTWASWAGQSNGSSKTDEATTSSALVYEPEGGDATTFRVYCMRQTVLSATNTAPMETSAARTEYHLGADPYQVHALLHPRASKPVACPLHISGEGQGVHLLMHFTSDAKTQYTFTAFYPTTNNEVERDNPPAILGTTATYSLPSGFVATDFVNLTNSGLASTDNQMYEVWCKPGGYPSVVKRDAADVTRESAFSASGFAPRASADVSIGATNLHEYVFDSNDFAVHPDDVPLQLSASSRATATGENRVFVLYARSDGDDGAILTLHWRNDTSGPSSDGAWVTTTLNVLKTSIQLDSNISRVGQAHIVA